MSEVLQRFVERAILLDEDKESLKKKRGFTDDVIAEFQLCSACAANKVIIEDCVKEFGEKKCAEVGLLHYHDHKYIPSIKYLTPNILIPYRQNDQIVALRPHKDFQKGQQLRVFYAEDSYHEDSLTIVAEGEFKAIAAHVYGYQAIAVPGISSFLGDKDAHKKFIEFYEELVIAGLRNLVFLFDNEDKETVGLPKYKEDPKLRYDTQYYSYLMAHKINEYGADLEARVGWIPDRYRDKNGKADIDSMLAAGVTEAEFDKIIEAASEPQEFLESLPQEALGVLHEKLAKRAERVSFKVKNGCYFHVTQKIEKDGRVTEIEEEVSNFTMKYISTVVIEEENEVQYHFTLTNKDGLSAASLFSGEDVSAAKEFKRRCLSRGVFLWTGNTEALDALLLDVIPKEQKFIKAKIFIGWDEELKCLFFDNGALDTDGTMVECDETGLIKIKDTFYKVLRRTGRPEVCFNTGKPDKDLTLTREACSRLIDNYASPVAGDVFAWFIAAAYKPWLFPLNRTFPILGVFGKKSSGKTRMMQWMLSIFYRQPQPFLCEASTAPGLRSQMSEYSYMPVWIDEFRNTQRSLAYLNLFRSVYDHGSVVIGSPGGGLPRNFNLKSSIVITGEHVPDDETGAILQRMIMIYLKDKPAGTSFRWFEDNYSQFSRILQYLYKEKDSLLPRIVAQYDQLHKTYSARTDIHNRAAINYALIHAVEKEILGLDVSLDAEGARKTFEEIRSDEVDFDLAKDFILRCLAEYRNPQLSQKVKESIGVKEYPVTKQLVVAFNLTSCVDIYNESLRRVGKSIISKQQIRRVMSQCAWVLPDWKVYRFEYTTARCDSALLEKAPNEIVLAAHGIASPEFRSRIERDFGVDGIFPLKDDEFESWSG